MDELKSLKDYGGWEEEQHQLTVIMSQIQVGIQATGVRLEEGPALLSYPGQWQRGWLSLNVTVSNELLLYFLLTCLIIRRTPLSVWFLSKI